MTVFDRKCLITVSFFLFLKQKDCRITKPSQHCCAYQIQPSVFAWLWDVFHAIGNAVDACHDHQESKQRTRDTPDPEHGSLSVSVTRQSDIEGGNADSNGSNDETQPQEDATRLTASAPSSVSLSSCFELIHICFLLSWRKRETRHNNTISCFMYR